MDIKRLKTLLKNEKNESAKKSKTKNNKEIKEEISNSISEYGAIHNNNNQNNDIMIQNAQSQINENKSIKTFFNFNKQCSIYKLNENILYIRNILENENELVKYINDDTENDWTSLRGRKVKVQGNHYDKSNAITKCELPLPFRKFIDEFSNHIAQEYPSFVLKGNVDNLLVNHYSNKGFIMPHKDGPMQQPTVFCISLMNPCIFHFVDKQSDFDEDLFVDKVLLEPNSLLIFKGDHQTDKYHCIKDIIEEQYDHRLANYDIVREHQGNFITKKERISLTFRSCISGKVSNSEFNQ